MLQYQNDRFCESFKLVHKHLTHMYLQFLEKKYMQFCFYHLLSHQDLFFFYIFMLIHSVCAKSVAFNSSFTKHLISVCIISYSGKSGSINLLEFTFSLKNSTHCHSCWNSTFNVNNITSDDASINLFTFFFVLARAQQVKATRHAC